MRGRCEDCATAIMLAVHAQIRAHDGPAFQHWRRQMAASVGGRLVDDDPPAE